MQIESRRYTRIKGPRNSALKKLKIFTSRVSGTLKPVKYAGKNRFYNIAVSLSKSILMFGHYS